MRTSSFALVFAALALAGCAARESETSGAVVELTSALERASERYVLASPSVVIGGLKERPDDEFNHSNGLLSAAAMSDGGLAVIDDSRLRLFGPDGIQRSVFGKEGRGPGEVDMFSAVCVTRGDTIVAYDITLRRVSVVAPGSDALTQFSANGIGAMTGQSCFGDGTFILGRRDEAPGGALGGMLSQVDASGAIVSELGSFPQMTSSLRVSIAASDDRFWVADPRTREIRRFDTSGRQDLVLRLREELRRMTPDEQASRSPAAARSGSASPAPRAAPTDEVAPLYERMLAESKDRLWIQLPVTDFRQPSRWVRVETSGAVRGSLELPGFSGNGMPPIVVQFSEGAVWLLHRDADGTATFRLHRLVAQSP